MDRHDPSPPFSEGFEATLNALLAAPARYSFDAAIAILDVALAGQDGSIHFHTSPGLATPTNDILAIDRRPDGGFDVTLAFTGLTGHGGTLPRIYTALVDEEHRKRSPALSAFLDFVAQQPLRQFAQAGQKYHYTAHRSSSIDQAILALTGLDMDRHGHRLPLDKEQILYFSGLLQSHPRSAERLRALLTEWLRVPVRVEQFRGRWLDIDVSERSCLPTGTRQKRDFAQLGKNTVIGSRVWDVSGCIDVIVGPLSFVEFEALCPPSDIMSVFSSLIALFLDKDMDCRVTLTLKKDEVPSVRLGQNRLGRNAWFPLSRQRQDDCSDLVFSVTFS